ncbi:hypothetical protein [Asticcacaulis benevestitus]|uniref:STAS/SEC14 domain-containing protein n=1 Tax=Asticcacaulis benevestitus DSM 16100 = ATCC BAA-896 TaxID=1121022 RepID=V4Q3X3_9CAUL|nr:hypothetical protein [Asticcacaulis benevestitus]ESQ94409.1 hypothetical protein ABENE_02565 [Asticcacaulis benevestitus DSM 16100 = ATCC BAA-896]
MQKRSRYSVTVDRANMILIIRLHSLRGDQDPGPDLIDRLATVETPWLFNALFDFRRHEADLSRDYLSFLTEKWTAFTRGRDSGRTMALVGGNPDLTFNLKAMLDVMPNRSIAIFDTFDEGLEWIKAGEDIRKVA